MVQLSSYCPEEPQETLLRLTLEYLRHQGEFAETLFFTTDAECKAK